MKKILKLFLMGIGYGGIIYVSCLYVQGAETQTVSNIASVLFISGLIGLCGFVFSIDSLTFRWQLLLHFSAVLMLVLCMNWYNGITTQLITWQFLASYIFIYLLVWLTVAYITHEKVERINEKLRQRENKS